MTQFRDPQDASPGPQLPRTLLPSTGSGLPGDQPAPRVPGYGAPRPAPLSYPPKPSPFAQDGRDPAADYPVLGPEAHEAGREQASPAPAPVDRFSAFLREMLQIALPAIILAVVVHLFLAQATVVFGQSMEPNLSPYQRLIVDKLSYRLHSPQRNDIVVIDLPTMDDMLVKRIVGLPGETIEIRDGTVLVDGAPLAEPFPHDLGHTTMAPVTLGALEYFVMGDNRDNSNDSRSFGPVHRRTVVGRVWLRYWPLDDVTLF